MRRALSFLTPLGGASRPSGQALLWFPVIGALLGFVLGGIWWASARVWSAPVAAAVVVVADLALTGMLHLDGLADSADGLLPHFPDGSAAPGEAPSVASAGSAGTGAPGAPSPPPAVSARARRLAVMADPGVGAFGVGAAGAALLLRFGALTALRPSWLLLGGLWCVSRTTMAVVTRAVPYARPEGGLASAFLEGPGRPAAIAALGVACSCAMLLTWRPVAGAVSLGSAILAASAVVLLAWRRVGGFTGDVLGASGLVGETVGLLVAAARW